MKNTKELIKKTFLELLLKYPYNKITVNLIVESCELNRNSFYYHFNSIPALVRTIFEDWSDNIIKTHYEIGSALSTIKPILLEMQLEKKIILNICSSVEKETFLENLDKLIVHFLKSYLNMAKSEIEELSFNTENLNLVLFSAKAFILGAVIDWLNNKMEYSLLEIFEKQDNLFEEYLVSLRKKIIEEE